MRAESVSAAIYRVRDDGICFTTLCRQSQPTECSGNVGAEVRSVLRGCSRLTTSAEAAFGKI